MKELDQIIKGRGETKGFIFTQIKKSENAYIYEVENKGFIWYEVFKRKINKQFNCVSYPKSKSFGLWAWTYIKKEYAEYKFQTLNILGNE